MLNIGEFFMSISVIFPNGRENFVCKKEEKYKFRIYVSTLFKDENYPSLNMDVCEEIKLGEIVSFKEDTVISKEFIEEFFSKVKKHKILDNFFNTYKINPDDNDFKISVEIYTEVEWKEILKKGEKVIADLLAI